MTGVIEMSCSVCEDTWHYLGSLDQARDECRDCGSRLDARPTEAIPA